jgi:hypothetical protein
MRQRSALNEVPVHRPFRTTRNEGRPVALGAGPSRLSSFGVEVLPANGRTHTGELAIEIHQRMNAVAYHERPIKEIRKLGQFSSQSAYTRTPVVIILVSLSRFMKREPRSFTASGLRLHPR